jgi:GDP-mannose 6-dehydrogenase
MKIGVFGLGYVGVVNVACLSKAGHVVYCTDVKRFKVDQVRSGKSPIGEPEVDELLTSGIQQGRIHATDDAQLAISESDVLIVCVGTPSKPDGEVNLSYLGNAVMEIAAALKPTDKKYIVFRSTVPPGTTEEIYNKYFGKNYPNVVPVFYPEFLREGSAVNDFYNYGRFVIGKFTDHNIDDLVQLLHVNPTKPSFITDLRTAEYSKYIDNGFHALKVAFANEIFGLASDLNVNVEMAHKIFVADDKLNISKYYLKPGLPFGGSCLPKDLRELQFLMKKSSKDMAIMKSVIPSNDKFIESLITKIVDLGKKKISFIGFTFKNNSDDLRESPMLKIVNTLQNQPELELKIWDEDINPEHLRVDYPHLYGSHATFEQAMEFAEVLVVSKRFISIAVEHKKPHQIVLNFSDIQGIKNENQINLYN